MSRIGRIPLDDDEPAIEGEAAESLDRDHGAGAHARAHILNCHPVYVAGFDLSLLMWTVFGVGTPRGLQGPLETLLGAVDRRIVLIERISLVARIRTLALHDLVPMRVPA